MSSDVVELSACTGPSDSANGSGQCSLQGQLLGQHLLDPFFVPSSTSLHPCSTRGRGAAMHLAAMGHGRGGHIPTTGILFVALVKSQALVTDAPPKLIRLDGIHTKVCEVQPRQRVVIPQELDALPDNSFGSALGGSVLAEPAVGGITQNPTQKLGIASTRYSSMQPNKQC